MATAYKLVVTPRSSSLFAPFLALWVGSGALCAPTGVAAQEPVRMEASGAADIAVFARPELQSVRVDLERLRAQLDAEGLLPVMVEEKAAEGLSKHVPAALILRACEQVGTRLRAARSTLVALNLPASESLLRALVDAQAVGATEESLTALGQQVRAPVRRERIRTTLVAVAAVAELGEREFLVDDALAAVSDALRQGGTVAVGELLTSARTLRGSPAARGQSLRAQAAHGRPEAPGRSGSSQGNGPPHDVGYGQGRGRGMGMGMGMMP